MDHNSTSAAGQAPAHIMRRRHSQAQHGLVSTSRSPPKHAPLNTSGPMETDNGELRSPTSPSIDPQHGVSIIMAPDNLPREIPVSPSRYTNDELEKMLNGASTTKTHVPRSAAGRTLLVVSGAGDALPSLFGPLLDSLSQALSIESPDPVFTSVDEISTEQLDLDRTSSSVLACTGYSAGDVLESLGSGKGIAKGRTFVAGLILIDAFIDPNHLERLKYGVHVLPRQTVSDRLSPLQLVEYFTIMRLHPSILHIASTFRPPNILTRCGGLPAFRCAW